MSKDKFKLLQADHIDLDAGFASDAGSCRRRIEKNPEISELKSLLAAQPELAKDLCEFVTALIDQPHDPRYRHPHETAVSAAMIVLADVQGPEVDALFERVLASTDTTLNYSIMVTKTVKRKDLDQKPS